MHTSNGAIAAGKDDAALIVPLLDGRPDDAGDADAVATHFHDPALPPLRRGSCI
jgi:hypothetical protein